MSERDDIVTRLRTDDASDDLLISAASLLETDDDEIERLRAEVARLTAEQDAVSAAIGTNEYMDPPDGGNVSLAEQVRRMRDALLARVEAAEQEADLLRQLCASAYQMAGVAGAPLRFLDALSRHDDVTQEQIDALLPVFPHEFDAAMEVGK